MTRAREIATQGGLVLISSTTVGSAVASVTISNCFSATFANYRVTYDNGSCSVSDDFINFKGSGVTGTPIVFTGTFQRNNGTSGVFNTLGGSVFTIGLTALNALTVQADLFNPFASLRTTFVARSTGQTVTDKFINTNSAGVDTQTNSSTGFVLSPASGTLTGGTIKVYGYK
jgi:hypothetical protein